MKHPVYFISHGGGPWAWIPEWKEDYQSLRQAISHIPQELSEVPQAILMISAHWITQGHLSVMSNPQPAMLYDYYGFPPHTYSVQYPAPGNPILAQQIATELRQQGFTVTLDNDRGFDHGAFVPLALAFPKADIPVIQLSIERSFNPEHHLRLGKALAHLREQGILIIASGLSFHNMRGFNSMGTAPSKAFDQWLRQALTLPSEQRQQALKNWEKAPAARIAHPMEDHLIPLMVVVGATQTDASTLHFHSDNIMGGVAVSGFKFGS